MGETIAVSVVALVGVISLLGIPSRLWRHFFPQPASAGFVVRKIKTPHGAVLYQAVERFEDGSEANVGESYESQDAAHGEIEALLASRRGTVVLEEIPYSTSEPGALSLAEEER